MYINFMPTRSYPLSLNTINIQNVKLYTVCSLNMSGKEETSSGTEETNREIMEKNRVIAEGY
jgi:hypothetical protein